MRRDTGESLHANSAAGDGSYVSTLSLLDSLLDHNVVTVTEQAWAASSSVLVPMYNRDRAAMQAYYHRLYDKCRDLDSKLQLDTSKDLASQPAWVQYCKECTNLVVLRAMFVNGEPSRKIDIGLMNPSDPEKMKTLLEREFKNHNTYVLDLSEILHKDRGVPCTRRQIVDMLNTVRENIAQLSTHQIVAEYYRLVSYCRDMDKVVDDSWEHRPSKFKQWMQFRAACHLAITYHTVVHRKQLAIFCPAWEKDNATQGDASRQSKQDKRQRRSFKQQDGLSMAMRASLRLGDVASNDIDSNKDEAAGYEEEDDGGYNSDDNEEEEANDDDDDSEEEEEEDDDEEEEEEGEEETEGDDDDNSISSSSRITDITEFGPAPPHEPYICLVRDKLVMCHDERRMGLAGTDCKTWEPQEPNEIFRHLPRDQMIVLDTSCVFPDNGVAFLFLVQGANMGLDTALSLFVRSGRDTAETRYQEMLEMVSTADYDQLHCQTQIGIAGADETATHYHAANMFMLCLRQVVYGKPIPVSPPQSMPKGVMYMNKRNKDRC